MKASRLPLSSLVNSIAISSIALSSAVFAAESNSKYYSGWNWSADLGTMNFDKKAAAREYIDDSATTFGFAGEYFNSEQSMVYAIGLEIIFYDDKASFSQNTTQGNKSSDASGGMLYVEAGPQYHFGAAQDFYFTGRVGYGGVVASNRGISYCTDCYEEDINIDGGAFGLLGIGHSFNSFNLGVQYRQFFSGDVDSNISVKVSTVF